MPSLTSFLPQIAPTLGLTKDALYERQRALVRMRLLPTPQGRGRGSGAEATPDTVALLIIACLATDNLSDTDGRVQKLAFAPFIQDKKHKVCPTTGKRSFAEALGFLLSEDASAVDKVSNHTSVTVSRFEPSARVASSWRELKFSQFGHSDKTKGQHLSVEAELPKAALQSIRKALQAANAAGDPK